MTARQNFDSAYSKLETTIRNFSREKLSFEANIAKQTLTISSLKTDIENLNSDIQKLQADKAHAESVWKQDEQHRCSVEAALIESEKKIEAYYMSLRHFENITQSIGHHIEVFESVIQTCKYRQVQLLDHIFSTEEARKDEKNAFKTRLQDFEKQMASATTASVAKYREYDDKVANLNSIINELHISLNSQRDEFETAVANNDILVKNLQAVHENQLSEKEAMILALTKANEEKEADLNAMAISNEKALNDICNEHHQIVLEKDRRLAAEDQSFKERERELNDNLNCTRAQLEEKSIQVQNLEVDVVELHSSVERYINEIQEKTDEHSKLIQTLSTDYQNQIDEKEALYCQLEIQLSSIQNELNLSLKHARQQCEEYVLQIHNIEADVNEKSALIENLQLTLSKKDEFIREQELSIERNIQNTSELQREYEKRLQEKASEMTILEAKANEKEATLTNSLTEVNHLLELSCEKVKNLEITVLGLETTIENGDKELQEQCIKHASILQDITSSNQVQLEEKISHIKELESKLLDLESKMHVSFSEAAEKYETACTKINQLEAEINIKKDSIETLNASLKEKDKDVLAMKKSIEEFQQAVETHRTSSLENLNNYKEMCATKERLEELCQEKLKTIQKELNATSGELADLRTLYNNRERAIAKFMVEAQPTIPISFQSQSLSKSKPPAAAYVVTQENRPEIKINKARDENKEKPSIFGTSPKSYTKAASSTNVLKPRFPNQSNVSSGILKSSSNVAFPVTQEKKVVTFKKPEETFNFKDYFNFDSSSGNSDLELDSPRKITKSNKAKEKPVSSSKIGGSKRIATQENSKGTPSKKEKSDVEKGDPIVETPKTPARKFFRSRPLK